MKSLRITLACATLAVALSAWSQQADPDVAQMQKLEDQWSVATVKQDQFTMENLLAPSFVGVSAAGEVSTRNQQIARLFDKAQSQLLSMEQRVVSVRHVGDTALVQGTYILKRRASGNVVEERGIFTHVFERTRSSWICVNSQHTLVLEESDAKPKSTARSSAELPFHVPFLHKGAESTAPAKAQQQAEPAPQ